MKRTVRVGVFVVVVAGALAASALAGAAGSAAGVGKAGAQAAGSPTPQASPTPARDERLWRRALALHRKAILVDGHNDIPTIMADEDYDIGVSSVGKYHTDIPRLKQSGTTGTFFSIYVDRQYATPDWVAKNYVTR